MNLMTLIRVWNTIYEAVRDEEEAGVLCLQDEKFLVDNLQAKVLEIRQLKAEIKKLRAA